MVILSHFPKPRALFVLVIICLVGTMMVGRYFPGQIIGSLDAMHLYLAAVATLLLLAKMTPVGQRILSWCDR